MQSVDQLLNRLYLKFNREGGHEYLLEENELFQATHSLYAFKNQLKPFKPRLFPLPSGAIPLYKKSFFPWGALPYPLDHAHLGALLSQLDDPDIKRMAQGMALFQEATLDHQKKPIFSLWQQERGGSYESLVEANTLFFEALQYEPKEELSFAETELGMVMHRNKEIALLSLASGCKTGMGAFFCRDAAIVNYGPQILPMAECAAFGLAGRGQNIELQNESDQFSLKYLCRLAAPHARTTGFESLQDSGYSGLWVESEVKGGLQRVELKNNFAGFVPLNKIIFTFFAKAESCLISRAQRLKPRSLDRYMGPAATVELQGKQGAIEIEGVEGISQMEVIPLAGDQSFWGADFLAAFSLSSPSPQFAFSALT